MTELNVETAFSKEAATAGASAHTIFGEENNSEQPHLPSEKMGKGGDISKSDESNKTKYVPYD